jgi:DNA-binding CsgD family transcriptional regulator
MHTDTLNLVGQIYDAVSEPERWGEFLENLAAAMGANAARMRMLDSSHNCHGVIAGSGHDATYDQNYSEYYSKVDLWNPILNQQNPGQAFDSHRLISDKEFAQSEIYNDFFRYYDMFYGLGGNILKSDHLTGRIGIHRAKSQGPFSKQEVALLKALMPHLMRAYKLDRHFAELHSRLEGVEGALNNSSSPLLLIDECGEVAFLNRRAESLLNEGLGLSLRHNHLQLTDSVQQLQLEKALSQAVATGAHHGTGFGGALRVTAPDGEHTLNLLITPYPDRRVTGLGLNHRVCAAVFLHQTSALPQLPAELLKGLYGLTQAEVRLAERIAEGLSPAEAAAKFGVSVNTTRTQLRSLFAKTSTQRQSELVRLLSGLTGII